MAEPGRGGRRPGSGDSPFQKPKPRPTSKQGGRSNRQLLFIFGGIGGGLVVTVMIVVAWFVVSSLGRRGDNGGAQPADTAASRPPAMNGGSPPVNRPQYSPTNKFAGVGMSDGWRSVAVELTQDAKDALIREKFLASEWDLISQPAVAAVPDDWSVVADPQATALALKPDKADVLMRIPVGAAGVSRGAVIRSVVPSPVLALGKINSNGGIIRIWDAAQGRNIASIDDLKVDMKWTALSPTGRYYAGSAEIRFKGRAIGVWDTKSSKSAVNLMTSTFAGADDMGEVTGIGIPRDDRLVGIFDAVNGFKPSPPKVVIWSIPDGAELRAFDVSHFESMAFSPGGRFLAIARSYVEPVDERRAILYRGTTTRNLTPSRSPAVYFIDLVSGQEAGHLVLPQFRPETSLKIQALGFSPDGTEFSILSRGIKAGKYLRYDIASGQLQSEGTWPNHWLAGIPDPAPAFPLQGFADGKYLLAFERLVLAPETGRILATLDDPGSILRGSRIPVGATHYVSLEERSKDALLLAKLSVSDLQAAASQPIPDPNAVVAIVDAGPTPEELVPRRNPVDTRVTPNIYKGEPVRWDVRVAPEPAAPSIPAASVSLKGAAWSRGTLTGGPIPHLVLFRDQGKPMQLEVVNLRDQTSRFFQPTYSVLDVLGSPQGTVFATTSLEGNVLQVDTYRIADCTASGSVSVPGGYGSKLALIRDDRLLVLHRTGMIQLYEVSSGQKLHEGQQASAPAWSSSGSHFGYSDGQNYLIVDAGAGQVTGVIPALGAISHASFLRDGTKLIGIQQDVAISHFSVADLALGTVTKKFSLPVTVTVQDCVGVTGPYVQFNTGGLRYLIDVEQGGVAWHVQDYSRGPWVSHPGGSEVALLTFFESKVQVTPAPLLNPRVLPNITGKPLPSPYLIYPGMSGTVNVTGPHSQEITNGLTATLRGQGYTIGGTEFTLTLTGSELSTGQETAEEIGGRARLDYQGKAIKYVVALTVDGTQVWGTNYHGTNQLFGVIQIKTGESVQLRLDESMASAAKYWGSGLRLPDKLFSPTATAGLGTSMIGE